MIEPVSRRPRRRSRGRKALWAVGLLLVVGAVAVGGALLAWPQPRVEPDDDALARIVQPGYAGRVSNVVVRGPDGSTIPVAVRQGRLWPEKQLAVDEQLTVELTVRRPGWAGWLVGHTARTSLVVRTPSAHLQGRWLEIRPGAPVVASFDTPVRVVVLRVNGRLRTLRFDRPRTTVDTGVIATGCAAGGEHLGQGRTTLLGAAAAGNAADLVPGPQAGAGTRRAGRGRGTGAGRPDQADLLSPRADDLRNEPADDHPGHARPLAPARHPYALVPTERPRLSPRSAPQGEAPGTGPDRPGEGRQHAERSAFDVRHGTILRLQQLLAQAGYLPVVWKPSAEPVEATAHAQLAAVETPPAGRFRWPYANTPHELRGIWKTGEWNEIVRGAVMMFEHDHGLDVDAFVGPKVWHALLADTIAGRQRTDGYSYVYVHRSVPQSLTLWHDGRTILSSPGNTGVPAAPTQLGTFPVFEHIPIGTMSGTNPDGTHYNDPGIQWISYFNHGDAIHSFTRSSFGTPQSLGCVELPLAAAAKVWPYTPIGTLVTVEN